MAQRFPRIEPVLPSLDIGRDVAWYEERTGFKPLFHDRMYAVLQRDGIQIHLQWHADTPDDPLLSGSVIRVFVADIKPWLDEFVQRGTVNADALRSRTPWGTNEFGFHDLNRNAIFIVQDL